MKPHDPATDRPSAVSEWDAPCTKCGAAGALLAPHSGMLLCDACFAQCMVAARPTSRYDIALDRIAVALGVDTAFLSERRGELLEAIVNDAAWLRERYL